ncbi:gluconate 5-dehydrogenase [Yersinia intermedia]|nr:gluconate 5-dehydrogenase [Yersinia sp. FDAARGOS_228]AVL36759.1 gluconate 5-dehydrogenase [Yersinia intermedia]
MGVLTASLRSACSLRHEHFIGSLLRDSLPLSPRRHILTPLIQILQ